MIQVSSDDLLRVLRRYLSPRLATKAAEAVEKAAAEAPPEPTRPVSDIGRARALKRAREAGVEFRTKPGR